MLTIKFSFIGPGTLITDWILSRFRGLYQVTFQVNLNDFLNLLEESKS